MVMARVRVMGMVMVMVMVMVRFRVMVRVRFRVRVPLAGPLDVVGREGGEIGDAHGTGKNGARNAERLLLR